MKLYHHNHHRVQVQDQMLVQDQMQMLVQMLAQL